MISQIGLNHQGPVQKTPVFVCLQGAELLSEKDLKRVAKPEELQWDLGGHRDLSPNHWAEIHQVTSAPRIQGAGKDPAKGSEGEKTETNITVGLGKKQCIQFGQRVLTREL